MLHSLQALYGELNTDAFAQFPLQLNTSHIATANALIPPAITEGCVEWPLSAQSSEADIWATLPVDQGARALVTSHLQDTGRVPESWAPLHRLLRAWSEAHHPVHDQFADLFIELDHAHVHALPIVAAQLAPYIARDHAQVRNAIAVYYQTLNRAPLPDALRRALTSTLHRLPQSAFIRHVCLMSGRSTETLRLVVTMRLPAAHRYVGEAGFSGKLLDDCALALARRSHVVGVQLDVAEDAQRIAIEVPPDANWCALFETLINNEAAMTSRTAALQSWLAPTSPHTTTYRDLLVKVTFNQDVAGLSGSAKAYMIFS